MKKDTRTVPKLPRAWGVVRILPKLLGVRGGEGCQKGDLMSVYVYQKPMYDLQQICQKFCLHTHASALQVEQIACTTCSRCGPVFYQTMAALVPKPSGRLAL